MQIKRAFEEKGIPSFIESYTNQQFVVLKNSDAEKLAEKYVYEYDHKIDEEHCCVRFCTSWSSKEEEIESLLADIRML